MFFSPFSSFSYLSCFNMLPTHQRIIRGPASHERLVKHQKLCYSSIQEHTFSYIFWSARMAHRDRTIRHVVSPHPHGLPVHSVVDIVLCYIFHDPRFLGGHDPRFLGGHHPRFWGRPLLGAPAFGGSRFLGGSDLTGFSRRGFSRRHVGQPVRSDPKKGSKTEWQSNVRSNAT